MMKLECDTVSKIHYFWLVASYQSVPHFLLIQQFGTPILDPSGLFSTPSWFASFLISEIRCTPKEVSKEEEFRSSRPSSSYSEEREMKNIPGQTLILYPTSRAPLPQRICTFRDLRLKSIFVFTFFAQCGWKTNIIYLPHQKDKNYYGTCYLLKKNINV